MASADRCVWRRAAGQHGARFQWPAECSPSEVIALFSRNDIDHGDRSEFDVDALSDFVAQIDELSMSTSIRRRFDVDTMTRFSLGHTQRNGFENQS